MDEGLNYDVQTILTFLLDVDYGHDIQTFCLQDLYKQFIWHVQETYQRDKTLKAYIPKESAFYFEDRWARLEYRFPCHGENSEKAEGFSTHCVQTIQEELESFGCKLRGIDCKAAESNRTRLNRTEETSSPTDKGKRRSGQER